MDEVESLRNQLDALKQELVWSNRLTTLGTMAAVLAHEYNNLLTPVGSYAQLALGNLEDAELVRKALEASAQGVTKAKAIAEATLNFAGPEESDHAKAGQLQDAIDQAFACMRQALESDRIQWTIHAADLNLAMPTLQLQQVLVNLIDNARKAMCTQHRPRRLSITCAEQDGGAVLEVADNGPGIQIKPIDQIFEAFVSRSDAETDAKGTGLGLSICKDLIESAGGSITALSEQGKGTTFRLWLALATPRTG